MEAPHLTKLAEEHKADGLVVLAVHAWSERESKADVEKFAKDLNLKHKILLNGRDTAKELYGVQWVPTVFFIDRDGNVKSVQDEESLEKETAKLLGKTG